MQKWSNKFRSHNESIEIKQSGPESSANISSSWNQTCCYLNTTIKLYMGSLHSRPTFYHDFKWYTFGTKMLPSWIWKNIVGTIMQIVVVSWWWWCCAVVFVHIYSSQLAEVWFRLKKNWFHFGCVPAIRLQIELGKTLFLANWAYLSQSLHLDQFEIT